MMPNYPYIIIIPEAFCSPLLYERVARSVRELGYQVLIAAQMFSNLRHPSQHLISMYEATLEIRELIGEQVELGKNIILVMHSYGGILGTGAVRGLSLNERKAAGKRGGVERLLYVAGLIPKESQPAYNVIGGPELPGLLYANGQVSMSHEVARKVFFSTLEDKVACSLTNQLAPVSITIFTDLLEWEGYRHVPCAYFVSKSDQAIPAYIQRQCLATLKASAPRVDSFEFNTGHFPWVSHPGLMVEWIDRVASGF